MPKEAGFTALVFDGVDDVIDVIDVVDAVDVHFYLGGRNTALVHAVYERL